MQDAKEQIPKGLGTPETWLRLLQAWEKYYQYSFVQNKDTKENTHAMDLRTIQDWIVRRQLLGVKGVADVSSFGGYLKQYEIALDPAKLNAMQCNY